jgi:hypothetical protein
LTEKPRVIDQQEHGKKFRLFRPLRNISPIMRKKQLSEMTIKKIKEKHNKTIVIRPDNNAIKNKHRDALESLLRKKRDVTL